MDRLLSGLTRALNSLTTAVERVAEEGKLSREAADEVKEGLAALVASHIELRAAAKVPPLLPGASGSLEEATAMLKESARALDDSKKFFLQKASSEDEITGEHIKLRWSTIGGWLVRIVPVVKVTGIISAGTAAFIWLYRFIAHAMGL